LEATNAKLYASEAYRQLLADAVQVMGGDAWTRFYPLDSFMRDAKVNEMGAGTSEVMRMVLYRFGVRAMAEEVKFPRRQTHKRLGVPISATKPWTTTETSEKAVLEMLAEDYRVNPGLYMSRNDMKESMVKVADEQLDKLLTSLEARGLVKLYKDRRGVILLAKATYKGLKEAKPLKYYQWFPEWIKKEQLF